MRTYLAKVTVGKQINFKARWYKDGNGCWRFVPGIARHLVDQQKIDLNQLWRYVEGAEKNLNEEMMRFYVSLGYTFSGFYEIFPKAVITIQHGEYGS